VLSRKSGLKVLVKVYGVVVKDTWLQCRVRLSWRRWVRPSPWQSSHSIKGCLNSCCATEKI